MRLAIILLLAALAVSQPALPAAAQSRDGGVVAAYRQISTVFPGYRYGVKQHGGRWQSHNLYSGEPIDIVVDTANGYIQIVDEGTGGGSFETQVVLWRKSDGSPLVGIAESLIDGEGPGQTRLRFYSRDDGQWEDSSDYVWPGTPLDIFLRAEMSIADLRAVRTAGGRPHIRLPRKGSTIEVRLGLYAEKVRAVCKGEDWITVPDRTPYLRVCGLEDRLRSTVSYRWLRDEGRFEAPHLD